MDIEQKIQTKVNLSAYSTFKIGGDADYFVLINNKDELAEIFNWVEEKNIDYYILGGGSNVVVNDSGFRGVIIKMNNNNITVKGERVECGAGANLGAVINSATNDGLTGLEWAIGVPGTVGGATRGNAGCFGGEMADLIETVEIFDIEKKVFRTLSRNDCKFDYRNSFFKENKKFIIWQILLKLNHGVIDDIKQKLNLIIGKRIKTQPKLPSAGSVFKNVLIKDLQTANSSLASRAESAGIVKNDLVGAGWLIDQLDLKGKNFGDIKISLEHANFIVNTGKGRAEEFIMLISFIKTQVRDKIGIQLQEEIEYIGF